MSIRTKRKTQTREALLNAAIEQCASGQSFSSLSLRQVTKLAGVVPATFYRHFKDMEDLGRSLVEEELGSVLIDLHKHMELGGQRGYTEKISTSVDLFFGAIDTYPDYWQFVVTERWGGSPAVCKALNTQLELMIKVLAQDLGTITAFKSMSHDDKEMLAEIGSNLFFSWIMDWIELNQSATAETLQEKRDTFKIRCTRQAKLVFFGAANWKPKQS